MVMMDISNKVSVHAKLYSACLSQASGSFSDVLNIQWLKVIR